MGYFFPPWRSCSLRQQAVHFARQHSGRGAAVHSERGVAGVGHDCFSFFFDASRARLSARWVRRARLLHLRVALAMAFLALLFCLLILEVSLTILAVMRALTAIDSFLSWSA